MPTFRKSETFEAFQFTGSNQDEIREFTGHMDFGPALTMEVFAFNGDPILWSAKNRSFVPIYNDDWVVKDDTGFCKFDDETFQSEFVEVTEGE